MRHLPQLFNSPENDVWGRSSKRCCSRSCKIPTAILQGPSTMFWNMTRREQLISDYLNWYRKKSAGSELGSRAPCSAQPTSLARPRWSGSRRRSPPGAQKNDILLWSAKKTGQKMIEWRCCCVIYRYQRVDFWKKCFSRGKSNICCNINRSFNTKREGEEKTTVAENWKDIFCRMSYKVKRLN